MQNRFIVKRLRELALKEYKDKRPTEIYGYRVKKSILLQRGFGPSIILSGLEGKIVPYLILADYGDHYRLYYILENGIIINAINIPNTDFERERLKFQKATTKLFQIPKPIVAEKKLAKVKKQLNEKFQNYIALIEKQTLCKVRKIPIITIYQSQIDTKLVIKRVKNFIKFPLDLIFHKLIDGFLIKEAYRLIFPTFTMKTKHMRIFSLIGAYLLLIKSLKHDWVQFWAHKEPLKDKLSLLNEKTFNSYLRFLWYLGKYESTQFTDSQLERLFSTFSKLFQNIDSIPEIAARCYSELADYDSNFLLKAILLFILANHLKEAKKALKKLSKTSQPDEIHKLGIQCEYLVSFQLAKFYSSELNFISIPSDIKKLFDEALNHIKAQVIEIKRIHRQKYSLSKPIIIQFKIKNLTDLTFQNIELKDELPKKAQVKTISSSNFYFIQLRSNENISCEYEIFCEAPQKIRFKNGSLIFEDSYGNHYIQTIPPTLLQAQ